MTLEDLAGMQSRKTTSFFLLFKGTALYFTHLSGRTPDSGEGNKILLTKLASEQTLTSKQGDRQQVCGTSK